MQSVLDGHRIHVPMWLAYRWAMARYRFTIARLRSLTHQPWMLTSWVTSVEHCELRQMHFNAGLAKRSEQLATKL
jgi:hypothetical protein